MNISIFGLGYVGCISLGCMALAGHQVIGVDVNQAKVAMICSGKPTILEKEIGEIIAQQHSFGRITATTDPGEAVKNSDISIICVGTPPGPDGHLDLSYIIEVARQIAESLKEKQTFHTLVIRSTVPPGTNRKVTALVEKISGKKGNVHFAVVSHPEFLREGSAVADYRNPSLILMGTDHPRGFAVMEEFYNNFDKVIIKVEPPVAEIIKYVNNAFHALKISFANEVGNICKRLGVDSHRVMDVFTRDQVLNISPAYLKPGFAYGGACLPKDLRALAAFAHDQYLETPVLNAIEKSNTYQETTALDLITKHGKKKIGVLGVSFKEGTDDLRNSPTVEIIERLLGKGYRVSIHDKYVHLSRLIGANKEFIQKHLPHIAEIISQDLDQVIENSEVLVVSHDCEEYRDLHKKYPDKIVIGLVRTDALNSSGNYEGICW